MGVEGGDLLKTPAICKVTPMCLCLLSFPIADAWLLIVVSRNASGEAEPAIPTIAPHLLLHFSLPFRVKEKKKTTLPNSHSKHMEHLWCEFQYITFFTPLDPPDPLV